MNAKETIQLALAMSNGAVMRAIDEMSDSPTTFPTANGGCHPLWILGHLTLVEGMIPVVLFGNENPAGEWQRYFGENTEPVADASAYPPFAEVRQKYLQLREQNLKLLESLSDEDLDKPTKIQPKGREREFATYGRSFLTIAFHQAIHRSHVTDAKRAAGRLALAGQAAN